MLRGMATATYWAVDMGAARAWYTELLASSPTSRTRAAASQNPHYLEVLGQK
jgi:hypothetical protein